MIDLHPVSSSSIRAIGHDPVSQTLAVQFANGSVYHYRGVDATEHAALVGADSIGKHFQQQVRGKFPHTRLDGPTTAKPDGAHAGTRAPSSPRPGARKGRA